MKAGTGTTATRRRIGRVGLLALLVVTTAACTGTWGIRSSYRSYVTSPVGGGSIETAEGVKWLDGPGTGKGPFQWPLAYARYDDATETGVVQFTGGVGTAAHTTPDGSVLETGFWNPRLEIDGDEATLVVDLTYRPYAGFAPPTLPPLEAAFDVPFAIVDLSGEDLTAASNGFRTISEAPTTGISAAMALIGWDQFYASPVVLDPFSAKFNPSLFPEAMAATPRIVVSTTEGLQAGDDIAVWGTGFDPNANTGTRPPLAGQPSGVYVTFGKFATTWRPSQGAPSSSRTVLSQRWALPAASRAILDPTGTNAAYVDIDALGRFEASVTVGTHTATGSYGVYVFPGSGAVNAAQELAQPVTLAG